MFKTAKKARELNRQYPIVVNNQARTTFYVLPFANNTVKTAAKEFSQTIQHITSAEIPIIEADFNCVRAKNAIFFTTIQDYPILKEWFPYETNYVANNDGFAIKTKNDNIYIFGSLPRAVFFGAMDMLEKATEVVWSRGKYGEEELFTKTKSIFAFVNYHQKSYFEIRGWHACKMGIHGQKLDPPTMRMFGKNKINAKMELFENEYMDYGVMPFSVLPYNGLLYFDELIDSEPELFMLDYDGKPKTALHHDSFMNYYNPRAAELAGQKFIDMLKEYPEYQNYVLGIKTPDDPHFNMYQNGVALHTQPFTTDDGITVYPNEPEYQSTVYWNYVNRMVKKVVEIYPNVRFYQTAYMYSELCPKNEIDEHVIIGVAPITLDGHLPFSSPNASLTQKRIFENVKNWCQKCKFVTIYEYWQCFNGAIYSRPNVDVVQKNLITYYTLGVRGIIPEGVVDTANALGESKHFDMNEMYYWITHKLMWNFDDDIGNLKRYFCKTVYGDASLEMLKYYDLIEKGWKNSDGYVVYQTGGDVYTRTFIINAGVAEDIKLMLNKALTKRLNDVQRRKISAIRDVVFAEIDKYSKYEDEEAVFHFTDVGTEELLSEKSLDYMNNPKSAWNNAGVIKVFKNYNTYENYDAKAKFNVKLLYDHDYLYFGYTVYDDMIVGTDKRTDKGIPILVRSDGKEVISYAETYVGGNSFNMERYFGYISGIRTDRDKKVFVNQGSPEEVPVSKEFKEAFFVHLSDNPDERYCFHVQAIPYSDLGYDLKTVTPYGSLVYCTNRYGAAGWKGNGLWARQGFSGYILKDKERHL